MHGLMMDRPLLVTSLIEHAARCHRDVEIVSRTVEGPIHRYSYADAHLRAKKLANALEALGVKPGDRIATLAVNGYRHFELYYGVSGMGAVCHTINPRLFADQIDYIVNHAEDRFIFVDLPFVPILEALADRLGKVEGYVIMTGEAHMPATTLANAMCYETLIAGHPETYDWPEFDERTAAAMCYTSGTTGNPKGTLYSHRSTVLHALTVATTIFGSRPGDVLLPVVPMFHVQAWAIPYFAPFAGSKLVFPGTKADGESLHELIESEGVTRIYGVPTVWLGMLDYLRASDKRIDRVERLLIGGAAPSLAMIRAYEEEFGVLVEHAWGMTEMSPVGSAGINDRILASRSPEEGRAVKVKQGQMLWGVEMKIVDDDGNRLPHDGAAAGELFVRGPWITSGYYNDEAASAEAFDDEGWFRTGDIATIDADGILHLTDRAKDLIRSGGEWISSIDLENEAMSHPDVVEAAAIAMTHPRWGERPLLVIVPRDGTSPTREDVIEFLRDKVAKWWLPDDVVFVDELPHTATGKVSKLQLRERFRKHTPPT
jgi:fatty-acyl-CoA synthase